MGLKCLMQWNIETHCNLSTRFELEMESFKTVVVIIIFNCMFYLEFMCKEAHIPFSSLRQFSHLADVRSAVNNLKITVYLGLSSLFLSELRNHCLSRLLP